MLIVTSGDPYSVSVELLTAHLAQVAAWHRPSVIVGSLWQWHDQARRLGVFLPKWPVVSQLADVVAPELHFLDVGTPAEEFPAESLSEATRGALALRALEVLRSIPSHFPRIAIVTAPIDKHACAMAGYRLGGQTEFFEALWSAPAVMVLAGSRLRVGLVTNHLALRDVADAIDTDTVALKLRLFARTLSDTFGVVRPRIAVCGLNPHAGDGGLFGDEEARAIVPAINQVRESFAGDITGPLPADTAFYYASVGKFDGVLAMYHDQGLGPLKTLHFDDAVNVSGGLRHLRVSPDHGPATSLFLRREASDRSFAQALDLAQTHLART